MITVSVMKEFIDVPLISLDLEFLLLLLNFVSGQGFNWSKGGLIRWNFSFTGGSIFLSTVSFQHLMRVYSSCEMWMKCFNRQSWKYFRRKNFYQIFDENFFFWNTFFTNQRSNFYWKWRKWLMWDEHERRNEWKFKNIRMKRKQRKIRKTDS